MRLLFFTLYKFREFLGGSSVCSHEVFLVLKVPHLWLPLGLVDGTGCCTVVKQIKQPSLILVPKFFIISVDIPSNPDPDAFPVFRIGKPCSIPLSVNV